MENSTAPKQLPRQDIGLIFDRHGDEVPLSDALRLFGWDDPVLIGCDFSNYATPSADYRAKLEFAKKYASGRAERTSVFMFGKPGRGKTHLARGIMVAWLQRGGDARYRRIQDVVARCKRLMQPDSMETPDQYIDWLCRFPGLLIVDELGRTRGAEWDIDHVIYPLVDRRKTTPTIWITNYSLPQLAQKYDEAITSRLQLCTTMVVPDSMPDWRAK